MGGGKEEEKCAMGKKKKKKLQGKLFLRTTSTFVDGPCLISTKRSRTFRLNH